MYRDNLAAALARADALALELKDKPMSLEPAEAVRTLAERLEILLVKDSNAWEERTFYAEIRGPDPVGWYNSQLQIAITAQKECFGSRVLVWLICEMVYGKPVVNWDAATIIKSRRLFRLVKSLRTFQLLTKTEGQK